VSVLRDSVSDLTLISHHEIRQDGISAAGDSRTHSLRCALSVNLFINGLCSIFGSQVSLGRPVTSQRRNHGISLASAHGLGGLCAGHSVGDGNKRRGVE